MSQANTWYRSEENSPAVAVLRAAGGVRAASVVTYYKKQK